MDISSLTPDKQVKLRYWLDVIRQCRASGAWCEQNNVSLKSYYYWIAKIRRLALEDLPRKNSGTHSQPTPNMILLPETSSEFAQVSLPDRHTSHSSPTAVLHIKDIRIEVFEDTSCKTDFRAIAPLAPGRIEPGTAKGSSKMASKTFGESLKFCTNTGNPCVFMV